MCTYILSACEALCGMKAWLDAVRTDSIGCILYMLCNVLARNCLCLGDGREGCAVLSLNPIYKLALDLAFSCSALIIPLLLLIPKLPVSSKV